MEEERKYETNIKVNNIEQVKRQFPDRMKRYIIRKDNIELEQGYVSTEMKEFLKSIGCDIIETEVASKWTAVIAGIAVDLDANANDSGGIVTVKTWDDKKRHEKKVNKVAKELSKHSLLENVQCKIYLTTVKVC